MFLPIFDRNILAKRGSITYLFSKGIMLSMKKGSTILIVEDEESHRLILKKVLTDNGYNIIEAVNGAEGLEIMRTSKIDMVISDLEMPKMDGMEFSKWVKDMNPRYPIVIVTGHVSNFSPKELLDMNIDGILHKPIEREELLKILDRL
jgi:CheY-like chemotaxis protein